LLSSGYLGRLTVYRSACIRQAGGFRPGFDGAHEFDLALRVTERTQHIHHVPKVLYHRAVPHWQPRRSTLLGVDGRPAARKALQDYLNRNSPEATAEIGTRPDTQRVRWGIRGLPLVTVVIPTAGFRRNIGGKELDLLANCVRSIVDRTGYPRVEIICVENGDLPCSTREAISAPMPFPVRIITYAERIFNVAAKMNLGAREARGEHLLFLNDDTEVLSAGWLSAMLEYSQLPEIGAVGAKLYFDNGSIQHAGVMIPPVGSPGHVYYGLAPVEQMAVSDLDVVRNYSAVTGACMMTRRDLFERLGGFDESFAVNYNDVDYCLKVRESGYRIVYTPFAELLHFESVSRVSSGDEGVKPQEVQQLRERWEAQIVRDPYHDPWNTASRHSGFHRPKQTGRDEN
jgi:GT2 family glycosyltransferase